MFIDYSKGSTFTFPLESTKATAPTLPYCLQTKRGKRKEKEKRGYQSINQSFFLSFLLIIWTRKYGQTLARMCVIESENLIFVTSYQKGQIVFL